MARRTGPTIGTTTKVISIKSRIKPSKKITSMTMKVAPTSPPGICSNSLCINASPPYPRNTSENTDAPIRIKNTIAVVRVVERATSRAAFIVIDLASKARRIAPIAPTAAASVGVAIPVRMEPRTANIRTKGDTRLVTISTRSNFSFEATAGARSGVTLATVNKYTR